MYIYMNLVLILAAVDWLLCLHLTVGFYVKQLA